MPSKGGYGRFSLIITKLNFATCRFPNIYIYIYIVKKRIFQEKLIQRINTVIKVKCIEFSNIKVINYFVMHMQVLAYLHLGHHYHHQIHHLAIVRTKLKFLLDKNTKVLQQRVKQLYLQNFPYAYSKSNS